MLSEEFKDIISQFQIHGEIAEVERFGSGNINDTYRSTFQGSTPMYYIHQKISQAVFPRPDQVMENMARVTRHIQHMLQHDQKKNGLQHAWKTTLELIPTKAGPLYYIDSDGEYWRTMAFIPNAVTYDVVQNPEHAYEAGRILGEFQRFVSDIPPGQLHDTLPGFHHTPGYHNNFSGVLDSIHPTVAIEARKQEPESAVLISKIRQHESLVPLLMDPYEQGILCARVVHNDPKINNILINTQTQRGICIVDLDTVKDGLIHFDYGDCLRSAANPAGEESPDLSRVRFDLKIFEWITKGYLKETITFLPEADIEYLVDSIKVITFELGTRFFTDYLKGDVYFKISYPTQNLNRAKVQFALLDDIEIKETEIRKILKRLVHKVF